MSGKKKRETKVSVNNGPLSLQPPPYVAHTSRLGKKNGRHIRTKIHAERHKDTLWHPGSEVYFVNSGAAYFYFYLLTWDLRLRHIG